MFSLFFCISNHTKENLRGGEQIPGSLKKNKLFQGKDFIVSLTVLPINTYHFQLTNQKPFFPTRKEKGCWTDFVNLTQVI